MENELYSNSQVRFFSNLYPKVLSGSSDNHAIFYYCTIEYELNKPNNPRNLGTKGLLFHFSN